LPPRTFSFFKRKSPIVFGPPRDFIGAGGGKGDFFLFRCCCALRGLMGYPGPFGKHGLPETKRGGPSPLRPIAGTIRHLDLLVSVPRGNVREGGGGGGLLWAI